MNENNVIIKSPNFKKASFLIRGNSPYRQLRFSQKTHNMLLEKMSTEGSSSKKSKKEARNYQEEYENAMYVTEKEENNIKNTK